MRLVFECLLIFGLAIITASEAECWQQSRDHSSGQAATEAHRYYNGGDYRNAIVQFLAAYKEDSDFRHLYYIAVAQSRMKNYQQAITFYLRYMQEAGNHLTPEDRLSVNREIERLRNVAIGGTDQIDVPPPPQVPSYDSYGYQPARPSRDSQAEYRAQMERERALKEEKERARRAAEEKRNREKAEKHILKGRELFNQQKYARAAKVFEKAYSVDPNPFYLWDIARVEAKLGNLERALDIYNQFLAQTAGKLAVEYKNAVELEMSNINKVLKDAEQTKEAAGRYELGKALLDKNEYGRALDELTRSYSLRPAPETLFQLARAQEGLGQIDEAMGSYQKYLAAPGKPLPKRKQASIEKSIRQLEELQQQKIARQKALAQNKAGKQLARAGKHEQALATYGQAYRYYPDPNILFNIGESASAMKKYDMAIDAYTEFLRGAGGSLKESRKAGIEKMISRLRAASVEEQNQQTARGLVESGQAHNKRRRYAQALKDFQAAYAVFPDHEILYQIAATQSLLLKHHEAIQTYEQYLEEGRGKISRERRTMVNRETKRLQLALEANAAREESQRLYRSAESLAERKNYEQAVAEFRAAYEISPNYEILLSLAQAEAALGSNGAALEAYKQYLSLGGGRIAPNQRAKIRQEIHRLIRLSSNPIE